MWDRKNSKLMTLSGGMKRRVLIAKALSHEPTILFLDEPTAGVDVELRKGMWENVRALRDSGVTVILTTHYIHEAEDMADRIGVINQGRADPGRGQGRADAQARQEAAHASIASSARCRAARACRTPPCARQWRQRAGLYLRHARAPHRHHRIAHRSRAGRNQVQGPRHDAELARGHLRRSREAATDEPPGNRGDLQIRDGALGTHVPAEHRLAGDRDLALFRGVRRGHRLAHHRDRGHRIRRLHRAGPGHAHAAHPERGQRLVRHLFPALHRHHLRALVGADLGVRNRARLCRRGRHQVDPARARDPRHRLDVRAAQDRPSGVDDRVPGSDRGDLQPARLRHRALGRRLREAPARAAPHHHARSPFSAARSIRSRCCRRSGRPSRCSIRWCIS